MGSITPTQSLRYDYVTDPISYTASKNLADDIAAQLDAADAARTAALKRPTARARRSANLSVAAVTIVTVTFDVEFWDTHAMIDIAGQPTRITCGATAGTGIYTVQARAQTLNGSAFTQGNIAILKNGTVKHQNEQFGAVNGHIYVAGDVWLGSTTDFLTCTLYHEGGGTVNMSGIDLTVYKLCN